LPGTTSKLQLSFPDLKILFNPEFLTEVTADQDMEFPDRQILGYTKESYNVSKDVMLQLPLATFEKIVPAYVAEFCKYAANTWFSAKVAKNNEMYDLFMKFNQSEEDYKDMISCISGDRRIGRTHLKVWHKGYRGYGGKCLIAGTKLRNDGDEFINIEDVEKGDYIYNGSKMDIVTGKEEREVDGVIKITARGRSIAGSKDHIHFVVENNKLIEKV